MSEQQANRAVVPAPATAVGEADQLMTLAKAFAESGYFPDARGWAQAVVKIQAGRELGFGPMASMTGLHVSNGKVTMGANLIAAAIRRSGRYDYRVRSLSDQVCDLVFLDSGKDVGESVFTMDDARRADLLTGKNAHTWKRYPRNMLFARAISNGAKWYCPDIFACGVYADGELDDAPEPIAVPVDVVATRPAKPPQPTVQPTGNGHGKLTIDEAAALADLRKQLFQGRGIIDPAPAAALWREILGRWGVQSAIDMTPEQRKELVSYLVTQIQTDQMREGLEGNGADNDLEGDAAVAAPGGSR